MTLLEICEPLFDSMCRLNRSARRKGAVHGMEEVRAEIKALFASMRQRAAMQPGIADQYEKIEVVLMFFVDFIIKESSLPFAGKWKELAFERNELAGDEKFFDMLEETLKDRSEGAAERLTIYYTCIGLGFTGWYTGQPEYLRKKMMEVSARIRSSMEGAEPGRICPDAYENVDTRDLIEPPGMKLLGIGIALPGLLLVLFMANAYLYYRRSADLSDG